ncbi:hypothetical protein JTB14_021455 [Gonioctena quinquepunctata]|nr:hypothetical protein JTB14_021455 [Gonioctena quinquepunctata]
MTHTDRLRTSLLMALLVLVPKPACEGGYVGTLKIHTQEDISIAERIFIFENERKATENIIARRVVGLESLFNAQKIEESAPNTIRQVWRWFTDSDFSKSELMGFYAIFKIIKYGIGVILHGIHLYQTLIWLKFYILTMKRNEIKQVIEKTQSFWKNDPEKSENKKLLKYLAKLERHFLTYIFCSTCMFLFKPLLVKGTTIYYYYRIPQVPFFVSYAIEFYVTVITMSMVIAVNLLISIVIVIGAGQFSNLNAKMGLIDLSTAEGDKERLKMCIVEINENIKYHDFLIRYVNLVDDIFSMLFVVLIGIITSLLCMNMYVLSLPHTTVVDMIRCGTMVCAFTTEFLFLYGVPAQKLMDEVSSQSV